MLTGGERQGDRESLMRTDAFLIPLSQENSDNELLFAFRLYLSGKVEFYEWNSAFTLIALIAIAYMRPV